MGMIEGVMADDEDEDDDEDAADDKGFEAEIDDNLDAEDGAKEDDDEDSKAFSDGFDTLGLMDGVQFVSTLDCAKGSAGSQSSISVFRKSEK